MFDELFDDFFEEIKKSFRLVSKWLVIFTWCVAISFLAGWIWLIVK